MDKKHYDINLVAGTIEVTDMVNKGKLTISFKTPDNISENDTNPLYEVANDLAKSLFEDHDLLLTIYGDDNKIHLTRSYLGLGGAVKLRSVDLQNPQLYNAEISKVTLPKTKSLIVNCSIVRSIFSTTSSSVSFRFCDYGTNPFLHVLDPKVGSSFEYVHNQPKKED